MEGRDHFEIQMSGMSQPSRMYVSSASSGELIIQPLHTQAPQARGAIIVKTVDPDTGFGSSQKLKSLLPKGFISNLSKNKARVALSQQTLNDSSLVENVISSGDLLTSQISQPETSLSMASQVSVDDIPHFDVSNMAEETLHYEDNSKATVSKVETKETNIFNQFSAANIFKDELQNEQSGSNLSIIADMYSSDPTLKVDTSISKENEKGPDVIKKTMVEAFVKMVVCRKVTVQTVDVKTGKILETDVRTVSKSMIFYSIFCFSICTTFWYQIRPIKKGFDLSNLTDPFFGADPLTILFSIFRSLQFV